MRRAQRAVVTITKGEGRLRASDVKYEIWKWMHGSHPAGSWTDKEDSVEFRSRYYTSAENVKYAALALGYRAVLTIEQVQNPLETKQ